MKIDNEKITLSARFKNDRNVYSTEIKEGVQLLYNIKNIPEVQVTFLSLRQRLLEDNHTLIEHYIKYKKLYRSKKGTEWENVSKIGQARYQPTEKGHLVDGKLSDLQEKIDLLKAQIDFHSEAIKTVDSVLFGIKDRIASQKLLDGN